MTFDNHAAPGDGAANGEALPADALPADALPRQELPEDIAREDTDGELLAPVGSLRPNASERAIEAAIKMIEQASALLLLLGAGHGLLASILALALALILAGTTVALCQTLAQRLIGGQTGDVIGATQQLSEIAALTALLILIPA